MTLTDAGIAAGWTVENMPVTRIMPNAVRSLKISTLQIADNNARSFSPRAKSSLSMAHRPVLKVCRMLLLMLAPFLP